MVSKMHFLNEREKIVDFKIVQKTVFIVMQIN